jgi:dihydrofolate reductase
MRQIINSTYVSLDGLTERLEEWHFEYLDDDATKFSWEQLAASDALLMGRLTYEGFAEVWPSQTGDFADKINNMRKYVASTTLEKADWNNSVVIKGDLVEGVTRIKQQPGQDILMYGFGPVAQTLLEHRLLDEVRLWLHPVFVGTGNLSDLLFREGKTVRMKLIAVRTFGPGLLVLSYQPAEKDAGGARDS